MNFTKKISAVLFALLMLGFGTVFAQTESLFSENEIFLLKKAGEERDFGNPVFQNFLGSTLLADRLLAVQVLGQTGQVKAIPLFKNRFFDSASEVRSEACFAVGQIGIRNKIDLDIVQNVKDRWNDVSEKVQEKCFEAFGKLSLDDTYPALTEQISKRSPNVVAAIFMAAFRARYMRQVNHPELPLFNWSSEFVDAYVNWANIHLLDNQQVAESVAYTSFLLGAEKAIPLLTKLAEVNKENVGIFTARSLGKFKTDEACRLLKKILRQSKNNRVQIQALQALNNLKAGLLPSENDLFRQLLKDSSYHIRSLALENAQVSIGQSFSELVLQDIYSLLNDSSLAVKNSSLSFLVEFCSKNTESKFCQKVSYPDLMLDLLRNPNWVIRQGVINKSSLHPDPKLIVSIGLADVDVHVRSLAIDQLAQFDTAYALNKLSLVIDSVRLDEKYSIAMLLSSLPIKREENLYVKKLNYLQQLYLNSAFIHFRDVRELIIDFLISEENIDTTELLKQIYQKETVFSLSEKIKMELNRRNVIFALIQIENVFSSTPFINDQWNADTIVLLTTTKGPVKIKFFKEAYFHVADFLGWVKAKKYDGVLFHRVISDFVAQGAQSNYDHLNYFNLRSEINTHAFERGAVGMPRSNDFDSGGGGPSLFINHIKTPHLDGMYTVFGQVIEGMDNVDQIEIGDLVLKAEIKE